MRLLRHLITIVSIFAAQAAYAGGDASDYNITILKPDPLSAASRLETNLVGKSIAGIFGPVSEVRVQMGGGNPTAIDGDAKKVEQRIRERVDAARCLGRSSEVAYHKAPWVHGHLLLKNGRILPMQILLSGIIIGDLLFDGEPKIAGRDGNKKSEKSAFAKP